jgi:DNA polymerase I-like protein with 3'-5' exonuclease and polymerase domains
MRHLKMDMDAKQIPHQFYRECMELSAICVEMQKRGLRIDRATIKKLETDNEYSKRLLFPFEVVNGKPRYEQFNPKSAKDVITYCANNNISLPTKRNKAGESIPSTEKNDIAELLEKMARREGHQADTVKDLVDVLDQAPPDEISGPLDTAA